MAKYSLSCSGPAFFGHAFSALPGDATGARIAGGGDGGDSIRANDETTSVGRGWFDGQFN